MAENDSPEASNAVAPPSAERQQEEINPVAPAPEPKLPAAKDVSLKEFLSKMDDYAPIVSLFVSHLIVTWQISVCLTTKSDS